MRKSACADTNAILNAIRSHGYVVTTYAINGAIEIHALGLDPSSQPEICHCMNGDSPEELQRCGRLLAQALGIDLKDKHLVG